MSRAPRRTRWLLVGAAVAVVSLAGACSTGKDAVNQDSGGSNGYVAAQSNTSADPIPVKSRQAAPTFTGSYLNGDAFDSTSLAGKVVVLNFWASWCTPCREESPRFSALSTSLAGKDVRFLGIAIQDEKQATQAFLDNKKISYPTLFDQSGRLALVFGKIASPKALPSTVVLDKHGRVAEAVTGGVDTDILKPLLTTLLAES